MARSLIPVDHLSEVRAALAAADRATPGPWRPVGRTEAADGLEGPEDVTWFEIHAPGSDSVAQCASATGDDETNAAAIVAIRNAAGSIAALVDEVEALRAALARRETAASPPTDAQAPCVHMDLAHDGSCFGCGRGASNTNPEATP